MNEPIATPDKPRIRTFVTVEDAVALLNAANERDPATVRGLFLYREECDPSLAEVLRVTPGKSFATVGLLSVVVSLFGFDAEGRSPIGVDAEIACHGKCPGERRGVPGVDVCPSCGTVLYLRAIRGFRVTAAGREALRERV